MPMFDYRCPNQCWEGEKFVHRAAEEIKCPECGTPALRLISRITVIPDSVPGGFTIENMAPTPQTFYSKSEYRDALRARGMRQHVKHVGSEGSDKSKFTTRWT